MLALSVQMVIALLLGIYGSRFLPGAMPALVLFSALLLPFAEKLLLRKICWRKILCWVIFGAGIFAYQLADSTEIRPSGAFLEEYVTLIGRISEIPEESEDGYLYIVDARSVFYQEQEYPVRDRIRIFSTDRYSFGDSIYASGFLETFSKPKNSGETDYGRYFKSRGIYFRMTAKESMRSEQKVKCYRLPFWVNCLKYRVYQRIHARYDGDAAAILDAVLLGYKKSFSEDAKTMYYRSGVLRYLYPSYLHISLLSFLAASLIRFLSKEKRTAVLVLLLILYGACNTELPVAVKAAGFLALNLTREEQFGFSDSKKSLAVVVGVMVLTEPMLAFRAELVMAVGSGLIFRRFLPLTEQLFAWIRPKRIRVSVSIWLVSTLGMLPLASLFFDYQNPYALLISCAVLPFVLLLYFSAPLTLLLFPILGDFCPFRYLTDGILFFLRLIACLGVRLPGANQMLIRPQADTVILFYSTLELLRICILTPKRRFQKQMAMIWCGGFFAVQCAAGIAELGVLRIDFVNVGQGDGAVLSIPFAETILIDGGGSEAYSSYDAGERVFLPYLTRKGFHEIDLAVVSHYHSDHCRGVIAAMQNLKVHEVLAPDCMWDNPYHQEIDRLAKEKGIRLSYYTRGDTLSYPSGLRLSVLSPTEETVICEEENDTSLVLRVEYGDFSALFTGDISQTVEERYMGSWEQAKVLKAAHHGSARSNSEHFLAEVAPEAVLIGVGEENRYHLPDDDTVHRFEEIGARIYRTDQHGDIRVRARRNGKFRVQTYIRR